MEFITYQTFDINKLQEISKLTYKQAFNNILGETNVNEYVNTTYSKDNLLRELNDPNYHFLFIHSNDEIIGYGMYTTQPDFLKIERVYILNQYKGLGAGSKFMRYVENTAKEMKKDVLCLEVLADNKKAISIYEKKGFRSSSEQIIMIGQKECPLLSMEKELHDD
ncbi:GNAT family N-acetyltransferase [Oceanobacillus jeddahense]|uniref:GNAT family N-acetyltransferase n=1 Tax=Oceanobacillus jeddahense TaxID=1462527 RepID=A0ABY5JMK9_9BACI|nr:GNAT family N-acetyltransferase [Oceanobacillus jeddahense]UUI01045.1 GNAT family N-acetyltransferase [Oceanobacillus jeddahense]